MKWISTFFLIDALSFMVSCTPKCDEYVQKMRDFQCNIVVDDFSIDGHSVRISGMNLETHNYEDFFYIIGWNYDFEKSIQKGDTVTKQKDKLVLYIRRKGVVLKFPNKCGVCEELTRAEDFQEQ